MADVSEEFWVQVVALLEQLHGPRITDRLDMETLQMFSAMLERFWQRLKKETPIDLDLEMYPYHLPGELKDE